LFNTFSSSKQLLQSVMMHVLLIKPGSS
jgi:hypothetical protein